MEKSHLEDNPKFGRRGLARRRALLDAAARLFAAKGFGKTTLSDIMTEAGGSRATLYEHFGDKAGLLRAMMEEQNERCLEALFALDPEGATSPEETLIRFGLGFVRAILSDDGVAIVRIIVAESDLIPDIAETFFAIGPDNVTGRVADKLKRLSEAGLLQICDPLCAARCFIGLITGNMVFRKLMLPTRPISHEEAERHVRLAVRLFLDGIAARPKTVS